MAEEVSETTEETEAIENKTTNAFLSPEGIIMLTLAIAIDVGEFILDIIPSGITQIISIILDIIALFIIGGWMFWRSQKVTIPRKTAARLKKMTSKLTKAAKWLKPACVLIELIPVISSFLPLWIVAVWLELKK